MNKRVVYLGHDIYMHLENEVPVKFVTADGEFVPKSAKRRKATKPLVVDKEDKK